MTPEALEKAAIAAARAQGCDCAPTITTNEIEPGIHRAQIAHDTWCRLLATRARGTN